jgi:hypothetical protein
VRFFVVYLNVFRQIPKQSILSQSGPALISLSRLIFPYHSTLDWKIATIRQIYKGKGNRKEAGNYKGILLLSVLIKYFPESWLVVV